MFWVGVYLGARLMGVGISMVMEILLGEILGVVIRFLGELEVARRVDFVGLVVVGRG